MKLSEQMSVISDDKVEVWQNGEMLFDNYRVVLGKYRDDVEAEIEKYGEKKVLAVECEYNLGEGFPYITIEID